jgi:hypothetical protein
MLTFPTHLFNPSGIRMRPSGGTITGGEALSGDTDIIGTDGGGYWIVEMEGIELISDDLVRAWRAWEDTLDGGVTKVLVPVADVRLAPRPIIGGRLGSPSALDPGSDDPYFPEAVGFATPFIVATVVEAAALRATQLTINIERGQRLKGGEIFALDHPTKGRRCYRVRQVLSRAGQQAVVSIRTPLREAVDAGANADFDWPSLVARLIPESDISPLLLYGRSGTVNIAFREAF